MKKAFTLIEVNLAIFIMAGGVLAMISLYSLGFNESRQSREDVASVALADTVLNPIVISLSSRNMTWSQWKQLPFQELTTGTEAGDGSSAKVQAMPNKGWFSYLSTKGSGEDKTYYVSSDPQGVADNVYSRLVNPNRAEWDLPSSPTVPAGMTYALVASRESENSPVITLALRCVRKNLRNTLMAQPVFSTDVHFQGDPNR